MFFAQEHDWFVQKYDLFVEQYDYFVQTSILSINKLRHHLLYCFALCEIFRHLHFRDGHGIENTLNFSGGVYEVSCLRISHIQIEANEITCENIREHDVNQ